MMFRQMFRHWYGNLRADLTCFVTEHMKAVQIQEDDSPRTKEEAHDPPGSYPHGSMPWSDDKDKPLLRAKRLICAAANHYPRKRFDGWCMGFGYGCRRCEMWADPWPQAWLQAVCDQANKLERQGKSFYLGNLCNGVVQASPASPPQQEATTDHDDQEARRGKPEQPR